MRWTTSAGASFQASKTLVLDFHISSQKEKQGKTRKAWRHVSIPSRKTWLQEMTRPQIQLVCVGFKRNPSEGDRERRISSMWRLPMLSHRALFERFFIHSDSLSARPPIGVLFGSHFLFRIALTLLATLSIAQAKKCYESGHRIVKQIHFHVAVSASGRLCPWWKLKLERPCWKTEIPWNSNWKWKVKYVK